MAHLTAIEFSDDSCVLVRVATRGTSVEVGGGPRGRPRGISRGGTFAAALRAIAEGGEVPATGSRRPLGDARRGSPRDPAVSPRLEPLISAGFKIDRVVSPCNALAALARTTATQVGRGRLAGGRSWRRRTDCRADRRVDVLPTRSTGTRRSAPPAARPICFIATRWSRSWPRRFSARWRCVQEKGRRVEAIVTCGTLPDLRSLTMPLIEELDTEVETLDSLDGLIVSSANERLSDMAAAIRIACAGAIARPTRSLLAVPVTAGGSIVWRVVGRDRSWRGGAGGCVVPDFETATRSSSSPPRPRTSPRASPRSLPGRERRRLPKSLPRPSAFTWRQTPARTDSASGLRPRPAGHAWTFRRTWVAPGSDLNLRSDRQPGHGRTPGAAPIARARSRR